MGTKRGTVSKFTDTPVSESTDTPVSEFTYQEKKVLKKDIKEKNKDNICSELENSTPSLSGISLPLVDKTFYDVPLEKIKSWGEAYPAVNVEQELKRMVAWSESNPTKKKTKKGVDRFINNWLSRTQDKGGSKEVKRDSLEEWANE